MDDQNVLHVLRIGARCEELLTRSPPSTGKGRIGLYSCRGMQNRDGRSVRHVQFSIPGEVSNMGCLMWYWPPLTNRCGVRGSNSKYGRTPLSSPKSCW